MSRTFREALDRLPVHRRGAWVLNRRINTDQTQVLIGTCVKGGHEYCEDNRARLRENVRAEATFGTKTIVVRAFDRLATSCSPRRQRPCHRASLVVRPVSSRKTNRVGASVGGRVPQASRAVFPAGRCCSCAGPVFSPL